jgi:transposase-like protein
VPKSGGPARKRLTDEEREQIADAIRAGRPRNEIARAFDRSQGTVSRIARQAGLEFDRSITKQATEAKQSDNAHRLEILKGRFLEESERLLSEMTSPTTVIKFHQGEWFETDLDQPTHIDQRNIMWTAGGAIRNYLEIDAHQGGGEDSFAAVDQWLDAMVGDD